MNEVSDQLNKRRNIRFHHQLALETDENEMPLVVATSLEDEVQRAVQNRFDRRQQNEISSFSFI